MVAPGDIIVARSNNDNVLMRSSTEESIEQHLFLDRLPKLGTMTTKIVKIKLEHI